MILNFERLKVWKLANELFFMFVADAKSFERSVTAKIITEQAIKSFSSIGANIAEGMGRGSRNELRRFLRIARGSLAESQDWIIKIYGLKWINKKRRGEYRQKMLLEYKMINSFVGKLKRQEIIKKGY